MHSKTLQIQVKLESLKLKEQAELASHRLAAFYKWKHSKPKRGRRFLAKDSNTLRTQKVTRPRRLCLGLHNVVSSAGKDLGNCSQVGLQLSQCWGGASSDAGMAVSAHLCRGVASSDAGMVVNPHLCRGGAYSDAGMEFL